MNGHFEIDLAEDRYRAGTSGDLAPAGDWYRRGTPVRDDALATPPQTEKRRDMMTTTRTARGGFPWIC